MVDWKHKVAIANGICYSAHAGQVDFQTPIGNVNTQRQGHNPCLFWACIVNIKKFHDFIDKFKGRM